MRKHGNKALLLGFLAVLAAMSMLFVSCGSGSDDDDADTAAVTAKVAQKAAKKIVDAMSSTGSARLSSRDTMSDTYAETITEDSELGGSMTMACNMEFSYDTDTGDGTISGSATVTFNDYKMDVDGTTYTMGGSMTMAMEGSFTEYTTTETGTITIDGVSIEINLTCKTTSVTADDYSTTDTCVTTGTIGGEAVSTTETYSYDSEGNEIEA